MKTHIFVATDGSEPAHQAVDLAAELAAKFDVPLTVGHVIQHGRPPDELMRMARAEHLAEDVQRETQVDFRTLGGGVIGVPFTDTVQAADLMKVVDVVGQKLLEQAADRAKGLGVSKVETISGRGDPADSILDMAQQCGADMIVLGHRGLGRVKTILLGSVAQKVVQQAECSVVSVR